MTPLYYIVFPDGNPQKLAVIQVFKEEPFALENKSLASNKVFTEPTQACEHAIALAKKHGLEYHHSYDMLILEIPNYALKEKEQA